MTGSFAMTNSERARFDRDGYMLRENVLGAEECRALGAECERLATRIASRRCKRKIRTGAYLLEFDQTLGVIVNGVRSSRLPHGN